MDTKSDSIVAWADIVFGLTGMAVAGGNLWVADYDHGRLMRIDLESNALKGHVDVGKAPVILGRGTDETGAVWVSNVSEGTVTRVKF